MTQITQLVFDFSQESSVTAKSWQPGWLMLACLSLLFCGFLKVRCRTACQPLCWKKLEKPEKNFKLHTEYLIHSSCKNFNPKCSTFSSFNSPDNCSNWARQPCLIHPKNQISFIVRKSVMNFELLSRLHLSWVSQLSKTFIAILKGITFKTLGKLLQRCFWMQADKYIFEHLNLKLFLMVSSGIFNKLLQFTEFLQKFSHSRKGFLVLISKYFEQRQDACHRCLYVWFMCLFSGRCKQLKTELKWKHIIFHIN